MRFITFIFLPLLFSLNLSAVESKSRVEELFIWKISDEMKLSVPEEKNFSDLIRSLNQRRQATNEELQLTIKKMSETKNIKDQEKLLATHRKLLKQYNDLTIEETDRIEKMFGTERAARYFVLKNDLTNRLKSVLAAPEKSSSDGKLQPPKIIEEK